MKPEHTVFAYSYAAKEIFKLARDVGCRTVLGQIDPGIFEEQLVTEEVERLGDIEIGFAANYCEHWQGILIGIAMIPILCWKFARERKAIRFVSHIDGTARMTKLAVSLDWLFL